MSAKQTKTGTKKTSAKKPAAAKSGKAPAKKTAAKSRSAGRAVIAKFPAVGAAANYSKLLTRRPPSNPELPFQTLQQMQGMVSAVRDEIENYSAHLRSLDRKRLNGVGVRKLGFIGRALQLAAENPEFLPHWLDLDKFQHDNNYYLALRSVYDIVKTLKEIFWNIVLEAADILYTDALEYYSQVKDAAKRRIDPAETLCAELKTLFERPSSKDEESQPTEKKAKRDFDALLHGKKDGKIIIENVKPKLTGGKHTIIDETLKDTAQFKKTEEGEITE
jgi:hypothetical protein